MTETDKRSDYDAVVVGAGFAGIYALHKLRNELGLSVRAFDKAGGIGGTWYWNRYPGALSDTESFVYRFSFDKDLLQDYKWNTRYLQQPQILEYLEHVVDRYDLRRDIQLSTGIDAARFDDARRVWEITTDAGEVFTARYFVTALGLLSATNVPDFKGLDTFEGDLVHTGSWPEKHDLARQRVGIIGTGSTGQQVITAIAGQVSHLTVFQRTPQYSVPVKDGPVTEEYVASVKSNYDEIWDSVLKSNVAFGFKESDVPAMSVSAEERERVFQENWDIGGGFRFMFATFSDIAVDPEANEAACAFVRSKIAEIVKDPDTARKLTPTDLYAKRPLCSNGYYDVFNRDNVTLVDVKNNQIVECTSKGILTEDGVEHELDVLILATGFEAVDGSYMRMELHGRGGLPIQEHWKGGPTSYLGITTSGFPNLFMVLGPNGPFTNLPPSIETQIDWIADLIRDAEKTGSSVIETQPSAEEAWTATCQDLARQTLFPKAESWIFGANTPGRPNTVMFFMGGLLAYRQVLADVTSEGYTGFSLV